VSFSLHGIGVSKGIAIGKVYVIDHDVVEVSEFSLSKQSLEDEVSRFKEALEIARQQLSRIRDNVPKNAPGDVAAFIDTHLLMLEDSSLSQVPIQIIYDKQCNAEWALKLQCDALVQVFDKMDDPYLSSRKQDVEHVVARVLRILRGYTELPAASMGELLSGAIVLADDLSPADTVMMQHHGILAFATEFGGTTSHTAILARSLGIPAIVGLHKARTYLQQGDMVIVDGFHGVLLGNPDEFILNYYRTRQREEKRYRAGLAKLKSSPVATADGTPIVLHANIEFPEDMVAVKRVGSNGIGLYRTEFLFLHRREPPNEEEHFEAYLRVVNALKGGTITIRTLDLGADKQGADFAKLESHHSDSHMNNPALSLRAIRLCLRNIPEFKAQLRAILRVSAFGNVRMLLPMISSLQELAQVMSLIEQVRQELSKDAIKFDPNMSLGLMVEVPAMAVCTDLFLPHVDFLSIGTNDLIQYTLAIDRCDDSVNYLYDPLHPAVLRLIKMSIDASNKVTKPISMCGEMASDSRYVRLLLGLGLRSFSVNPEAYLEVKQIILNSNLATLSKLASKVLKVGTQADINTLMQQINTQVVV